MGVSIISGLYLGVIFVDSFIDQEYCEIGLSYFNTTDLRCFAHDDFFSINLGYNIDCVCFSGTFMNLQTYNYNIK